MLNRKHPLLRTWRGPIFILMCSALGGCAVASTPAREAQELSSQRPVVREQLLPVLRLARAARSAGDLASAVNLYRTVIAGQPEDADLAVEYADTLQEAGAFDEAINAYGKVNAASTARLGALLGLGRVHLTLGQTDKALIFAQDAAMLAPSNTKMLVLRGVVLDTLGRHAEAQESYRAVIGSEPLNVAARNNLALSLALDGQYSEAVEILAPMAKSTTAPARVRQNLALIYGLMGDTARAAELSLLDLDKPATEANLRFFDYARSGKP